MNMTSALPFYTNQKFYNSAKTGFCPGLEICVVSDGCD